MDRTRLIVKNLPNTLNVSDYFESNYGAIKTKSYGRRRIIISFPNEELARSALYRLHQSEISNRIISAEYIAGGECLLKDSEDSRQPIKDVPNISEAVKALYASSNQYGFEQPPPPYLKYCYPKINRSILDSISIALLSNTRFYTQVLHLMNRMNLEPPFLPLKQPFVPPGDPCDAQTQTDFDKDMQMNLLASDESELESDKEDKFDMIKQSMKRKRIDEAELIKKKARKILNSGLTSKVATVHTAHKDEDLDKVFELNETYKKKISLNVSSVKLPETSEETEEVVIDVDKIERNRNKLLTEDLKTNRIPENQISELPIFKNYQKGQRSNKLYIKNLSKDVTENDLHCVYDRFVEGVNISIDIKLMQHGRMKGQAFITFADHEQNLDIAEKALNETNGYILKNKPMVVCFGKSSK